MIVIFRDKNGGLSFSYVRKSMTPLTDDTQLALISQEKRLRLALEYLNYNGVLYTHLQTPLTMSNKTRDRSAS